MPDYLEVLPGAFSSSVCGRALSGKPASTIGFEKKFNAAFRITDENKFVETGGILPNPSGFVPPSLLVSAPKLDRSFCLTEQIEPFRAGYGFPYAGELSVRSILECALGRLFNFSLINN